MRKRFNDVRFIFTALQVSSVIAILFTVHPLGYLVNLWPEGSAMLLECALWWIMWGSYLRMCGRLKREPSAFTRRNGRTLLIIAVCCGAMGALLLVASALAVYGPSRGMLSAGWVGGRETAVICFGMMVVALVLRWLLKSAMDMQQDIDLTI